MSEQLQKLLSNTRLLFSMTFMTLDCTSIQNRQSPHFDFAIHLLRRLNQHQVFAHPQTQNLLIQITDDLLLETSNEIHLVWSADDVLEAAHELGYELSEDHCIAILDSVHENHDCNLGVSWLTLKSGRCWTEI
jgi:hypothetical protein